MNKKLKVMLDMDGVLVNMIQGTIKALGITDYEIPNGEYDITKWKGVNVTTAQFWKKVDETNEHFWDNLEKYEWSDDLVKLCESYGEIFILTSPSRNPYCLAGKLMWLNRHYPRLTRKIIMTPHKYLCAAPGRVLLDDSDKKIEKFAEYNGGTILFPQPWNKNHILLPVDRLKYVKQKLEECKNA
jgi:5'(3')-deoxyribonucleotidase